MIDDELLARMFKACWNVFPVARRTVYVGGNELRAIKVDESMEQQASMWGINPGYDATYLIESSKELKSKDLIRINENKISKTRRIGVLTVVASNYYQCEIEDKYSG